jgi:DNA end-binding protein Ku
MPRPIWSGAIAFGLVNVPVKLYSAVRSKDVRFHELHAADGVRLTRKRMCPAEDVEVPYEEVIKGYEISPGRYVTMSREELESLAPKATRSIDIEDFVDLDEIDPVFFEHPYYLVPDRGAAKAYSLLLAAMRESRKVAIARVVIRTKGYLAAIRPMGDALAMTTMLFADEVIPQDSIDELPRAEAEPTERELRMAEQLIASLTTDFEPERYRDEYRERVLELIERKAEGQVIEQPEEEEEPARVLDLVAALEASLAEAKGRNGAKGKEKAPARAAKPRSRAKKPTSA